MVFLLRIFAGMLWFHVSSSIGVSAFDLRSFPDSRYRPVGVVHARLRTSTILYEARSDVEENRIATEESLAMDSNAIGAISMEPHEELMYTLGINLARQLGDIRPLMHNGTELAQVAKGLLDTVVGRLSDEDQKLFLAKRGKELNLLIASRAAAVQEQLAQAGREMLEIMASTEGAVTLQPSQVVVHVLDHGPEKGNGMRPTKSSSVKIHYHGTLADGTIFDSTLGGEPATLPLAGVIPGWREGVLRMHEGETAMIGIPPAVGYGAKGTPDGRIPPDSTLFFKVQLLEVLSVGIGGAPSLLGSDGTKLIKPKTSSTGGGSGLLGVDGRPL
jgi:FKBP-type peptidyl-prolyl cis-trans isomerase